MKTKRKIGTLSAILNVVLLALAWLALSSIPNAFWVTPAPDGGYPGSNTAEGDYALFSLTTGEANTAIGFDALYYNTTGYFNTATGNIGDRSQTVIR